VDELRNETGASVKKIAFLLDAARARPNDDVG
jgi:hypothetical protein